MRITPEWQELVRERLDEEEWDQKRLAAEIGASPGAVTGMLKPGATQSRLVQAVCKVLDIPEPEYQDERERELFEILREIRRDTPDEFDKIEARARRKHRDLKKSSDSR